MTSPELIIIGINLAFIIPAYFYFYPKYAGSNGNKIAGYDLLINIVVLCIAFSIFGGQGIMFSIIFTSLNWFWFTLIAYAALEIPLMLWYFKKNDVWASFAE